MSGSIEVSATKTNDRSASSQKQQLFNEFFSALNTEEKKTFALCLIDLSYTPDALSGLKDLRVPNIPGQNPTFKDMQQSAEKQLASFFRAFSLNETAIDNMFKLSTENIYTKDKLENLLTLMKKEMEEKGFRLQDMVGRLHELQEVPSSDRSPWYFLQPEQSFEEIQQKRMEELKEKYPERRRRKLPWPF